jgi:UDP-N-acetylmuramate dehydrogenase
MRRITDCDLTGLNSYRIPARCAVAYFPESEADLITLTSELAGQPFVLIGSGHNIILARQRYVTPFVIFNGNLDRIDIEGERVHVGAGVFTATLCDRVCEAGLSGLEVFYDIPSSIGGAVVMNAGAYGEEIGDRIETIRYLDQHSGIAAEMKAADAGFTYRNSVFQQDNRKIVTGATLRLTPGNPAAIREKMETIKADRWAKQPRDYPNAGSVFKRPQGKFVGPMVDELRLKGKQVGGFRVSPKHGGFIEKVGPGTGADLLQLIGELKSQIDQAFEVDLEIEQRIIDVP